MPALNHLGLWVDDLPAAVAHLGAQGMRFTPGGIRKGAAGHDVCFLHPKGSEAAPKSGQGVLIELVQVPIRTLAPLPFPWAQLTKRLRLPLIRRLPKLLLRIHLLPNTRRSWHRALVYSKRRSTGVAPPPRSLTPPLPSPPPPP